MSALLLWMNIQLMRVEEGKQEQGDTERNVERANKVGQRKFFHM